MRGDHCHNTIFGARPDDAGNRHRVLRLFYGRPPSSRPRSRRRRPSLPQSRRRRRRRHGFIVIPVASGLPRRTPLRRRSRSRRTRTHSLFPHPRTPPFVGARRRLTNERRNEGTTKSAAFGLRLINTLPSAPYENNKHVYTRSTGGARARKIRVVVFRSHTKALNLHCTRAKLAPNTRTPAWNRVHVLACALTHLVSPGERFKPVTRIRRSTAPPRPTSQATGNGLCCTQSCG